jgi:drug/metabolite transporter (DMT)-like permease
MEKFSWLKMAGLITGLAGAGVLILGNGFNIGFSGEGTKSLGVVILVAQNILSSFMIILQKQLSNDHGPMTTAALITLSSVPWTILTATVFVSSKEWTVSPAAIGGITYAVIAVGLIAGNLYGWAVKNTDSSIVGASVTLNPLVASIFAAIFLGETVGLKDLIGGALILAGFGITSFAKFRETKEDEKAKRKLDPEQADLIDEADKASSRSDLTDSSTSLEMNSMTSPKIELEDEDVELN